MFFIIGEIIKSGSEWIFLGLFVVEIFLKIYTLGFKEFINDYWNM